MTTVVAVYATALSTASFVVAFLAYRASGPRVIIRASVLSPGTEDRSLQVTVLNSGSSDATIDFEGILFMRYPSPEPLAPHLGLKRQPRFMKLSPNGHDLPHRLPGHDQAAWTVDLNHINWDLEHELGPADQAQVILRVGAKRRRALVQFPETRMYMQVARSEKH
jgi:hypothetical protein